MIYLSFFYILGAKYDVDTYVTFLKGDFVGIFSNFMIFFIFLFIFFFILVLCKKTLFLNFNCSSVGRYLENVVMCQ